MERPVKFFSSINKNLNIFTQLSALHLAHRNSESAGTACPEYQALPESTQSLFSALRKRAQSTKLKVLSDLKSQVRSKGEDKQYLRGFTAALSHHLKEMVRENVSKTVLEETSSLLQTVLGLDRQAIQDNFIKLFAPSLLSGIKFLKVLFKERVKEEVLSCLRNQNIFKQLFDLIQIQFYDEHITKADNKKRRDGKQIQQTSEQKASHLEKKTAFVKKTFRAFKLLVDSILDLSDLPSDQLLTKLTPSLVKLVRSQKAQTCNKHSGGCRASYAELLIQLLKLRKRVEFDWKTEQISNQLISFSEDADYAVNSVFWKDISIPLLQLIDPKQLSKYQHSLLAAFPHFGHSAFKEFFESLRELGCRLSESKKVRGACKLVSGLQGFVSKDEFKIGSALFVRAYFQLVNKLLKNFTKPQERNQIFNLPVKLVKAHHDLLLASRVFPQFRTQLSLHLGSFQSSFRLPVLSLKEKRLLGQLSQQNEDFQRVVNQWLAEAISKKNQIQIIQLASSIKQISTEVEAQLASYQFSQHSLWRKARVMHLLPHRLQAFPTQNIELLTYLFDPLKSSELAESLPDFKQNFNKLDRVRVELLTNLIRDQNPVVLQLSGKQRLVKREQNQKVLCHQFNLLVKKKGISDNKIKILTHLFQLLLQFSSLRQSLFALPFYLQANKLNKERDQLLQKLKDLTEECRPSWVLESANLILNNIRSKISQERGIANCLRQLQFIKTCNKTFAKESWTQLLQEIAQPVYFSECELRGQVWVYFLSVGSASGQLQRATEQKEWLSRLVLSSLEMAGIINIGVLRDQLLRLKFTISTRVIDRLEKGCFDFMLSYARLLSDSSLALALGFCALFRQAVKEVSQHLLDDLIGKCIAQTGKITNKLSYTIRRNLIKSASERSNELRCLKDLYDGLRMRLESADFSLQQHFQELSEISLLWTAGFQFDIIKTPLYTSLLQLLLARPFPKNQYLLPYFDFFNFVFERESLLPFASHLPLIEGMMRQSLKEDSLLIPRGCEMMRKTMGAWQGFSPNFESQIIGLFIECLSGKIERYKKLRSQEEGLQLIQYDNLTELITQFSQTLYRFTFSNKVIPEAFLFRVIDHAQFPLQKTAYRYLSWMYQQSQFAELQESWLASSMEQSPWSFVLRWSSLLERMYIQQNRAQQKIKKELTKSEEGLLPTSYQKFIYEQKRHQKMLSVLSEWLLSAQKVNPLLFKDFSFQDFKDEDQIGEDSQYSRLRSCLLLLIRMSKWFAKDLREWLNKASAKKYKHFLIKLFERLVSECVFEEQCKKIQLRHQQWRRDQFLISCHTDLREIQAEFLKQSQRLSIAIRFQRDYPNSFIGIVSRSQLKLEKDQIRLRKMQVMLRSINGSVLDALLHWKFTLDKELEGFEVCAICYDIVNPATKELPKKACKTCKKKFHSSCIVRWLQSTNKNECALCKSQFS